MHFGVDRTSRVRFRNPSSRGVFFPSLRPSCRQSTKRVNSPPIDSLDRGLALVKPIMEFVHIFRRSVGPKGGKTKRPEKQGGKSSLSFSFFLPPRQTNKSAKCICQVFSVGHFLRDTEQAKRDSICAFFLVTGDHGKHYSSDGSENAFLPSFLSFLCSS